MLQKGHDLGPYVMDEQLGRGAYGIVWKAHRKQGLQVPVAIKIPLDGEDSSTAYQAEADTWLRVTGHPNIVPVLEAVQYGEFFVLISEFVQGGSLRTRLREVTGGRVAAEEAVKIAVGIAQGLVHLHSARVVHRDLKPENVLLQAGVPRLADFGIARVGGASQTGQVAGTIAYMSPETFQGKVSTQADLWAAGIILYEMLTGKVPFYSSNAYEAMDQIRQGTIPALPADIPQSVVQVVHRALERDIRLRYGNAGEMVEDLEEALADLQTRPVRGADARVSLTLTRDQAARGGSFLLAAQGRQIPVTVPAAAQDGTVLTLEGRGRTGRAGGLPGNLLVEVQISDVPPPPEDLRTQVRISPDQARMGGSLRIDVEGSWVTLNLRPGTHDGEEIVVPGAGRAARRDGVPGDLRVQVQVTDAPIRGDDVSERAVIPHALARTGGTHPLNVRGRTVEAMIPAGTRTGDVVRVARLGQPGRFGGPPGDLQREIEVAAADGPAPSASDLFCELSLTEAQARAGGEFTVWAGRREFTVAVPRGVQDQQVIRLPGRGEPGARGGEPGTLVVTVNVQQAPAPGADCFETLFVTRAQARDGGTVGLPLPGGLVPVPVPRGARTGAQVVLEGKGGEGVRGGRRGDLIVTLSVEGDERAAGVTSPSAGAGGPPFLEWIRSRPHIAIGSGVALVALVSIPFLVPPRQGAAGAAGAGAGTGGATPCAITSTSLPQARIGQPYSAQVTADCTPSNWQIQGLPEGLQADASGKISGTPKRSGKSSVTLEATGPGNKPVPGVGVSLVVETSDEARKVLIEISDLYRRVKANSKESASSRQLDEAVKLAERAEALEPRCLKLDPGLQDEISAARPK